ncbi:MAG TPA: PilN domain-containing protein [Kofleriaceae bacterium]|nr:PilN domain-containing protein [Kofleriaceae bacterium]
MIKVNLLPQRKARRQAGTDVATKQFALGCAAVIGAAAAVFLLVDMPKRSKLSDLRAATKQLQGQIADKQRQLQGYEEQKKAEVLSLQRAESVERLIAQKVIPAHVLHELGKVLTAEGPTMTEAMTTLTSNVTGSNSNKRFQADWDPQHVWMTSFLDKDGSFRIEGGAQSESDVTQLMKRLAASVYFMDVAPAGVERVSDRVTGISYFKYSITGKVAY